MSKRKINLDDKVLAFYKEATKFFDSISGGYEIVDVGSGDHQLAYMLSRHDSVKSVRTVEPALIRKADYYSALIKKPFIRFVGRIEDYTDIPTDAFLTGLHLCGELTDKLISAAVKNKSPFVVQTCCHTQRNLLAYADLMRGESVQNYQSVGHFIDEARLRRVKSEGFEAEIKFLPVTSRENRIILGEPLW